MRGLPFDAGGQLAPVMVAGVTKISLADDGGLGADLVLGVENDRANKCSSTGGPQKLSAGSFHMKMWQIVLSAVAAMVRSRGLEPPPLSGLRPQRSASANSAMTAVSSQTASRLWGGQVYSGQQYLFSLGEACKSP